MKNILSIMLYITIPLTTISCYTGGFGGADTDLSGVGNQESKSQDDVSFKNHTNTNYGFDAKTTEVETYISIKSGNNLTTFVVDLFNIPDGKAETSDANCATIASGAQLADGDNPVEIRSGLSPASGQINISGCTGETTDDCYVERNHIDVKVYDEKFTNLNIHRLNGTSFNVTGIENYFNNILKQAVCVVDFFPTQDDYFDQTRYDKNNNGYLDLWYEDRVPSEDEFSDLKSALSSYSPGIIVVKNNIRTHLLLIGDNLQGATTINVNRGQEAIFRPKDWLYLGPTDGSNTNVEKMWVYSAVQGTGIIYVQRDEWDTRGTRYDHPASSHTLWSDERLEGLTSASDNFAVIGEYSSYKTAVHEYLHMDIAGSLKHVVDEDNVMFWRTDISGDLLRYRPINNPEGQPDQEQWSFMQQ